MYENLFQPMHLVWASIIALIIIWSGEAWREWRITWREHHYFRKVGDDKLHQYRLGSSINK
jgi:hypothetical protein